MSRVGNRPLAIKEGVTLEIKAGEVVIKSNKGEIAINVPSDIEVKKNDNIILVSRTNNSKFARSQHGLVARLIRNGIEGLSAGIKKTLEFKGTGYRARVENGRLILNMGYSHEIELSIPQGVEVSVVKNSIIIVGYEASIVGNFAAKVREVRPPEVYKGKGIKYSEETIRRKDGKVASGGKG